jgi:hypothetical protein
LPASSNNGSSRGVSSSSSSGMVSPRKSNLQTVSTWAPLSCKQNLTTCWRFDTNGCAQLREAGEMVAHSTAVAWPVVTKAAPDLLY